MVHTGPNTQFGGASSGRINVAYHVGIAENVNKAPMLPAICGSASATIKAKISRVFILALYTPIESAPAASTRRGEFFYFSYLSFSIFHTAKPVPIKNSTTRIPMRIMDMPE